MCGSLKSIEMLLNDFRQNSIKTVIPVEDTTAEVIASIKNGIEAIVNIDGNVYDVCYCEELINPCKNDVEFVKGCAYIVNDKYVLPFIDTKKRVSKYKHPGVYRYCNDIDVALPLTEGDEIKYSINNVVLMRADKIFEDLKDKPIVITDDINSDGKNIKKYILNDEDSTLLFLVKKCINSKGINPKDYQKRFDGNDYSNTIGPLAKVTNLSFDRFVQICDKFDIEWKITCKNRVSCLNPMEDDSISYHSKYYNR